MEERAVSMDSSVAFCVRVATGTVLTGVSGVEPDKLGEGGMVGGGGSLLLSFP